MRLVSAKIVSIAEGEIRIIRSGSRSLPFVDFISSTAKWFVAESVEPKAKFLPVDESCAVEFFNKIEWCMLDTWSLNSIHIVLNNDHLLSTVVINMNGDSRL